MAETVGEGQIAVAPQAGALQRVGRRIDYEALAGLEQPTAD